MTDIRAVFIGDKMVSDYELDTGALLADAGLQTAVIISLFTDRRAEPDDTLPAEASDKRGWWGDAIAVQVNGRTVEDDRIGSRLWLLSREKQLASVVERARQYCKEALASMSPPRSSAPAFSACRSSSIGRNKAPSILSLIMPGLRKLRGVEHERYSSRGTLLRRQAYV